MGAVYDAKWVPPPVAYSSVGVGISNGYTWNHTVTADETVILVVVSYYDIDDSLITATFDGKPMNRVGYQDRVAAFWASNSSAGTKTITMGGGTASYAAGNSAAFKNANGIGTVVINPATGNDGGTHSATITSVDRSITAFCTGQAYGGNPGTISGGATQRFWMDNGGSAAGLFTLTGTGASQSFSMSTGQWGNTIAVPIVWR